MKECKYHIWNITYDQIGKRVKKCRKCDTIIKTNVTLTNLITKKTSNMIKSSKNDRLKFIDNCSYGYQKLDFETPFDEVPIKKTTIKNINFGKYRTCYHYIAWISGHYKKPKKEYPIRPQLRSLLWGYKNKGSLNTHTHT